jgi:hypothetical protein
MDAKTVNYTVKNVLEELKLFYSERDEIINKEPLIYIPLKKL